MGTNSDITNRTDAKAVVISLLDRHHFHGSDDNDGYGYNAFMRLCPGVKAGNTRSRQPSCITF